jgi:hypothetical protein
MKKFVYMHDKDETITGLTRQHMIRMSGAQCLNHAGESRDLGNGGCTHNSGQNITSFIQLTSVLHVWQRQILQFET